MLQRTRHVLTALALAALIAASLPTVAAVAGIQPGESSSDFDGDGYEDLATSALYRGEFDGAGSVTVLPGDAVGLVTDGASLWTQDTDGIPDRRQPFDAFGSFLEGVDFNLDGYDDLAIGVQQEGVDGKGAAGAFHVIPGSPSGLTAIGSTFTTRATEGVAGKARSSAMLGFWLAAGDFNADGFPDLAVAAPFDSHSNTIEGGSVQVFWGSAGGVTTDSVIITEETSGIPGKARNGDWFGLAVAAGDLDGDGADELVVGSDDYRDGRFRGSVTVIPGDPSGLDTAASILLTEATGGVPGQSTGSDGFGHAVTVGALDDDSFDDLVIGAQGDRGDRGSLTVLFGSAAGLTTVDAQRWTPATTGIPDPQRTANLGYAVSIADVNGDGLGEVVAGMPHIEINDKDEAGAVLVLAGTSDGPTNAGAQFWTQASPGVPSVPESNGNRARGDSFGFFTRGRDINGDGYADLLIGVPGEDMEAGALQVLLGSASGLTTTGQQFLSQADEGVPGQKNDFDNWGSYIG